MQKFKWISASGFALFIFLMFSGIALSQSSDPQVLSVVNFASGSGTLAPGSLAAIFGKNLTIQPSTVPISVFVNGIDAAVLDINPQRLTVQLPVDVAPGVAQLQVANQVKLSAPLSLILDTYAPGIFLTNDGLGSVWRGNGIVSSANPAVPGDVLSLLCVGLGPTTPVIPTGVASPSVPRAYANAQPTVTVDGVAVPTQPAYLEPDSVGKFRVFFTLPRTIPGGTHSVNLAIGNKAATPVSLIVAGSGSPTISTIVSSAGFVSPNLVAPGSIVTILGTNFGSTDHSSLFPSLSIEGISVRFNGVSAPLFAEFGSQNLINVYVPAELQDIGILMATVTTPSGTSAPFAVQMTPSAPAIFRIPDPAGKIQNNGAVTTAGTAWIAAPASLATALQIPQDCSANHVGVASTCAQPVSAGDTISIFATGLGKATAEGSPTGAIVPTGSVASPSGTPLYRTLEVPRVVIGQIPAQVLFSGLVPGSAGLYQLNVVVPKGVQAGDQVSVVVTAGNNLTDSVTIAIR